MKESLAESYMPAFTSYQAEELAGRVPLWSPANYGAIGDGLKDDTVAIQRTIDQAVLNGKGTIVFAPGNYKVTSTITIPITAREINIIGYGATITGAVNGNILHISDTTTTNNAARGIYIHGLTIAGSGYTDTVYPDQCGIEIDAVLGLVLRDVSVLDVPKTGIIGTKSAASGSTYWNKVTFDNVKVRFCGYQGLLLGTADAIDDITMINCLVNHCGEKVASNLASGSSYIKAVSLSSVGLEVSGNYSISNAGFGYRWGLQISTAAGALIGSHFEINGADQAGSADLLLDTNANGLAVIGSDHYGDSASGAKWCIQSSSKSNLITNIAYSGGATRKYDYVLECNGATAIQIGPIRDIGGVGVNTLEVNPGNSISFAAYDASCIAGKGQIATTSTEGFLYLPTCLGTPTGVPVSRPGYAAVIVNATNNKLYFYSGGAWRDAGP